jgi:hypothetical protein
MLSNSCKASKIRFVISRSEVRFLSPAPFYAMTLEAVHPYAHVVEPECRLVPAAGETRRRR